MSEMIERVAQAHNMRRLTTADGDLFAGKIVKSVNLLKVGRVGDGEVVINFTDGVSLRLIQDGGYLDGYILHSA